MAHSPTPGVSPLHKHVSNPRAKHVAHALYGKDAACKPNGKQMSRSDLKMTTMMNTCHIIFGNWSKQRQIRCRHVARKSTPLDDMAIRRVKQGPKID